MYKYAAQCPPVYTNFGYELSRITNTKMMINSTFSLFFVRITCSVGNDASLIEICSEIEIIGRKRAVERKSKGASREKRRTIQLK